MSTKLDGSKGIIFPDNSEQASAAFIGFRNKLINGAIQHWQRGTVISVGGSDTYTADRWGALAAGNNFTVSRVDHSWGTSLSMTGAVSNTLCDIFQRIESINTFGMAGKTVSVSFKGYRTDAGNIGWEIHSANAKDVFSTKTLIASGSVSVTAGTYEYKSFNCQIPANYAGTGLELRFKFGALVAGKQAALAEVQLEVSDKPTEFERRPEGYELALCQRYCRATTVDAIGAWEAGNSVFVCSPIYFQTMRAAPTLTGITSYTMVGVSATAAGFFSDTTDHRLVIASSNSNGQTAGVARRVYGNQLGFLSAEL